MTMTFTAVADVRVPSTAMINPMTVVPSSPVAEVVRLRGTYANARTLTDQPAVGAPPTTTSCLTQVLLFRY